MSTEAPTIYEATGSGTWPDGTSWQPGDRVASIPLAHQWLIDRGHWVPVALAPGGEQSAEQGASDAAD